MTYSSLGLGSDVSGARSRGSYDGSGGRELSISSSYARSESTDSNPGMYAPSSGRNDMSHKTYEVTGGSYKHPNEPSSTHRNVPTSGKFPGVKIL